MSKQDLLPEDEQRFPSQSSQSPASTGQQAVATSRELLRGPDLTDVPSPTSSVEDFRKRVDAGVEGISPTWQTAARSGGRRGAQASKMIADTLANQQATEAKLREQQGVQEQRTAERLAKESARAAEDQARKNQAMGARTAAAAGAETEINIENGRAQAKLDANGNLVFKPGPVGDPKVAIAADMTQRSSGILGGDGAATAGGGTAKPAIVQDFRNSAGEIVSEPVKPKTDPKTGVQTVAMKDSFGREVTQTVGVDPKIAKLEDLARRRSMLDLQRQQLDFNEAQVGPGFHDAASKADAAAKKLAELTAKPKFVRNASGQWVRITDDGRTSYPDPMAVAAWETEVKAAQAEVERLGAAKAKIAPQWDGIQKQKAKLEKAKLDLAQEEVSTKWGIDSGDSTLSALIHNDDSIQTGTSAPKNFQSAADPSVPPVPTADPYEALLQGAAQSSKGAPLLDSVAMASIDQSPEGSLNAARKVLAPFVTPENLSIGKSGGTDGDGYFLLMHKGGAIGTVTHNSEGAFIELNPGTPNYDKLVNLDTKSGVPVYLGVNTPNRKSPAKTAEWAKQLLALAETPLGAVQGPNGEIVDGSDDPLDTPSARNAALRDLGGGLDQISHAAATGEIPIQVAESLAQRIYGASIKPTDPTDKALFAKWLAETSRKEDAARLSRNELTVGERFSKGSFTEKNAVRRQFIGDWYAENRGKPGVTRSKAQALMSEDLAASASFGEKAKSAGSRAGDVALNDVGASMLGLFGGAFKDLGAAEAALFGVNGASDELQKSLRLRNRDFASWTNTANRNRKIWFTSYGQAKARKLDQAINELKATIDAEHDSPIQDKAKIDAAERAVRFAALELHQMAPDEDWPVTEDALDPSKDAALGNALARYIRSADPNEIAVYKERLLMGNGRRQFSAEMEKLTAGKNRFFGAFTGASQAGWQELGTEIAGDALMVATGTGSKLLQWGLESSGKIGAATRIARLGNSLSKSLDSLDKIGTTAESLANPLTRGQKLANAAVGITKTGVKGFVSEGMEEVTAEIGSESPKFMESFLMGGFGGIVLAPAFHVAGLGINRVIDNAAAAKLKAADTKFASRYNSIFADTPGFQPITPEQASFARGFVNNSEYKSIMDEAAAAVTAFRAARSNAVESMAATAVDPAIQQRLDNLRAQREKLRSAMEADGISPDRLTMLEAQDAQMAEQESKMAAQIPNQSMAGSSIDRLMQSRQQLDVAFAKMSEQTVGAVEAINEINGLESPAKQTYYRGIAKIATGNEASLTQNERNAIAGAKTSTGAAYFANAPDGRTVLTDEARAELRQAMPALGKLVKTTESEALFEAQVAAAAPTEQQQAPAPTDAGIPATPPEVPIDTPPAAQGKTASDLGQTPAPADAKKPASQPAAKEKSPANKDKPASNQRRVFEVTSTPGNRAKITDPATGETVWEGKQDDAEQARADLQDATDSPLAVANRAYARLKESFPGTTTKLEVEDGPSRNSGGAVAVPGKILVNLEDLTKNLEGYTPERRDARMDAVLDEEFVHVLQYEAVAKLAPEGADPIKFTETFYENLWSDFTPAQQKAAAEIYQADFEQKPDWHKAAETVRMLIQQRQQGRVTELTKAFDKNMPQRLIEILGAAIKYLKSQLVGGKLSPKVQAHIDTIESMMADAKSVAGKRGKAEAASVEAGTQGTDAVIPEGKEVTLVTPNNEETIKATATAVNLDQLVGSEDPRFPGKALQPRDRKGQASAAQREEMVKNLRENPEQYRRYLEGSTTDTGRLLVAPLFENGQHATTEDGRPLFYVLSGNGRRNAIAEASRRGQAAGFFSSIADALGNEGIDTADMAQPVPVAIYQPNDGAEAIRIAELSNRDAQLAVNNTEQATRDARSIESGNLLNLWAPDEAGNIGAASNRDFVKAFAKETGDEGILSKTGDVTEEGILRIERALIASLLGPKESALLEQLFNRSEALGLRNIIGGIATEAGSLLKLAIDKPEFDLTPVLSKALTAAVEAKSAVAAGTAKTVDDYFSQGDLFGDNTATPESQLAQAIASTRSKKAVREILSAYRTAADKVDTTTSDMFGETTSRADLIAKALEARPIDQVVGELEVEFGPTADLPSKLKLAIPAIRKLDPTMRRDFTAAIGAEADRLRAGVLSAPEWQRLNPDALQPRQAMFQRFLDSHTPESIQSGFNRLLSPKVQEVLNSSPSTTGSFLEESPLGRRVAAMLGKHAEERLSKEESFGAADVRRFSGNARKKVLKSVRAMADAAYAKIGGHPFSGKPLEAMLEPDTVFDVLFSEGSPVAFSIIKPTKEGLKSTLSGTDSSLDGVDAWKAYFERHRVPGYYVEASGKVERYAISQNIPTVSVNDAGRVIGKDINPDADGIHYEREIIISGLPEMHRKVIFGVPWSLKNIAPQTSLLTSSTSRSLEANPSEPNPTPLPQQSTNGTSPKPALPLPNKSGSTDAQRIQRTSAKDSSARSDRSDPRPSLGIFQKEMPQIKINRRGRFARWMVSEGIGVEIREVNPDSLTPSQADLWDTALKEAHKQTRTRNVIVSADGYILDGHHQWQAAREKGKDKINVVVIGLPARAALDKMHEFERIDSDALPGTEYENEEYQYGGKAPADWRKSDHPEAGIVNPIDPDLSPDEKTEALLDLAMENVPLVERILANLRENVGAEGKYSMKLPERIQGKASRPSIRKDAPWHDIEHVRDGLRFKVTLTHFSQIEQIAAEFAKAGVEIIKFDTKKMFNPKEWGWRFVGFDMRMPNGQLVEFYAPLGTMDQKAVKEPNHLLFEKWRNIADETWQNDPPLAAQRAADVKESRGRYDAAFMAGVEAMGLTYEEAEALFNKAVSSAGSSIRSQSVMGPLSTPSVQMRGSVSSQDLEGLSYLRKINARPSPGNKRVDPSPERYARGLPEGFEIEDTRDKDGEFTSTDTQITVEKQANSSGFLAASSSPQFDLFADLEPQILGPRAKAKANAVAAAKSQPSNSPGRAQIAKRIAKNEGLADLDLFAAASQKSLDAKPKKSQRAANELDLFDLSSRASNRRVDGNPDTKFGQQQSGRQVAGTADRLIGGPDNSRAGQPGSSGSSGSNSGRGVSGDPVAGDSQRGAAEGDALASQAGREQGPSTGIAGPDAPRVKPSRSEPSLVPIPADEADRNARIDPAERLSPKGGKAKIDANFAAINLLRTLNNEARNPTPQEKRTLLAYSGWGAFKGAFDDGKAEKFAQVSADGDPSAYYNREWKSLSREAFRRQHGQRSKDADGKEQASIYDLYAWNENHGETHRRLKAEMSDSEYAAARRSVLNAHYTTPEIIGSMWDMLEKLGFRGGRILEPSAGIGHYIGTQPENLARRSQWNAVELDQVTAQILGKLYPEARVNSESPNPTRSIVGQGFEDASIAPNSMDLVISNVPFHEDGPWQSRKQFGIDFNLHNYFFARALEVTKPGGLVAFITSSSTMENNAKQRQKLASMGDLVTAVRLPNTAFQENAGTQVTTDIIILRKPDGKPFPSQDWQQTRTVGRDVVNMRPSKDKTITHWIGSLDPDFTWVDPSLKAAQDRVKSAWAALDEGPATPKTAEEKASLTRLKIALETAEADYRKDVTAAQSRAADGKLAIEMPIRINEYFANHPDHAFGQHRLEGSMYRANEYSLAADETGPSLAERFKSIIDSLPENITGPSDDAQQPAVFKDSQRGDKPFSFVQRDGGVFQVEGAKLVPVEWTPAETATFLSWSRVKDATRAIITAELDPSAKDSELKALRDKLNRDYDSHVARHGPISKTGRASKHGHLLEDPDFTLTSALEEEQRSIRQRALKSGPRKGTMVSESVTTYSKADIFRTRMNKPLMPPDAVSSVADAVNASMVWMGYPNADYMAQLTGKDPAAVEREALESGLVFTDPKSGMLTIRDAYLSGNVREKLDAAREAMEQDPAGYRANVEALEKALPERKSIAKIGANLGAPWVPYSVVEAYMTEELGLSNARVNYVKEANHWQVFATGNSAKFSIEKVPTVELLDHAMSLTSPKVTKKVGVGTQARVVPDPGQTQLAGSKLEALKADFTRWVKTTDHAIDGVSVQQIVEDAFNEKLNGFVPPRFEGAHITLPGASDIVYRNGIRRAAIARLLDQGSGMIAHGVGFGKTFTLIGLAMEMKRLGKANRPMITVENATLHQFAASFRAAYPNARLLVADEKTFSGPNRRRFVARVATGDFDAIVMAHSQFNLIANHPDVVNSWIDQQIDELKAVKNLTDSSNTRAVAALEKAMISLENSRKRILDDLGKRQDMGLYWEDLGVDALLVDEAHRFKNAPVITKMTDIKNIPTGVASQRAIGMTLKTLSVQAKKAGKGVFFATGTPVTNTMAEAYIMLRYTSPELLEAQGIYNFDNFAQLYGDVVEKVESTWKGKLESVKRFAKFVNGSALINLIRSSWDVQMDPDAAGLDRPTVRGGKSELLTLEPGGSNQMFNDWVINSIAAQWEDPKFWDKNPWGQNKKEAFENEPWLGAVPIMTMHAGIAAALDPRLIDPASEDSPSTKVNTAVRRIREYYDHTADWNGSQAVFVDLRKPFSTGHLKDFAGDPGMSENDATSAESFDLYQDIAKKLVAVGIPRSEIALVNADMPKPKRSEIFEKVNSGEIRVVVGSSDTMGIGVNMQERLYALHHLMPPRDFKPAMMEQRNGRILRQGNMHYDLEVAAYVEAAEKATGQKFQKEKKGKLMPDIKAAKQALADLPEARAKAETAAEKYHIRIIEYGMEKSIDSAVYQMMAAKQQFINQILMGEVSDSFEDPTDEVSMSMAEMAARTIGDPLLIRMVELDRDSRTLNNEYNGWLENASSAKRSLSQSKRFLEFLRQSLPEAIKTAAGVTDNRAKDGMQDVWKWPGTTVDRNKPENAEKGWKQPKLIEPLDLFLLSASKDLRRTNLTVKSLPFTVAGIDFTVRLEQQFGEDSSSGTVTMANVASGTAQWKGAMSLNAAIQGLMKKAESRPADIKAEIAKLEKEIPRLEEVANQPFEKQAQLDAVQKERDEVKHKLQNRGTKIPKSLLRSEGPETYPGRGLAPEMQALASSPSLADITTLALASMPPIYRQVFAEIVKTPNADPATIAAKFGMSEKAVMNITNQVRSRVRALSEAASPSGLSPAMVGDKFNGGRPDLALSTNPGVAAVDQIRNQEQVPDVRSQDVVTADAEAMLSKDYTGTYDALLVKARDLTPFSDTEVAAAKILIARETIAGAGKTPEERMKLALLIHGYRDIGTETARSLAMRRDPHKSPAERHAQYIAEALYTPDPATRERLRKAPRQNHQSILAGWLARVDGIRQELKAQGVDIDASLAAFQEKKDATAQAEAASPEVAKTVADEIRKLGPVERNVVNAIRSGSNYARAAIISGIDTNTAKAIYAKFYNSLMESMRKNALEFVNRSLGLAASPSSSAEAIARELGFAAPDDIDESDLVPAVNKKRQPSKKPTKRQQPKPQLANPSPESQARLDEAWEKWQQSGNSSWKAYAQEMKLEPMLETTGDWNDTRPFTGQGDLLRGPINETTGTFDLNDPKAVKQVMDAFALARGTKLDALMEFWRMSILSGPQTHIVNIGSNTINSAYNLLPRRAAEATVNSVLGLIGQGDTKSASFGEFSAMAQVLHKAAQGAARTAIRSWQLESHVFEAYATGAAQQLDFTGLGSEYHPPALGGKLGKLMRSISFRAMTAADEFQKRFYGELEAAAQAHRIAKQEEKLTGDAYAARVQELMQPGSVAWVRALEEAKRITFQQDLDGTNPRAIARLDQIADIAKRAREMDYLGKPITLFLPFINTPLNVLKQAVNMSPLGGMLAVIDGARALKRRIMKGDLSQAEADAAAAELYDRTRFVQDLTNQMLGIALIFALKGLVEPDKDDDKGLPLITGTQPYKVTKAGERAVAMRTMPPQSIRIGDTMFSYSRVEPFATMLASTVDSILALNRTGLSSDTAGSIASSFKDQVNDKTFLKGVSDLINAWEEPERFAETLTGNIITGFVPNIVRQPVRELDTVARDTSPRAGDGFFASVAKKVGYSIVPKAAPAKLDVWGNTMPANRGNLIGGFALTDMLVRIIDPTNLTVGAQIDPIDRYIFNYNLATADPKARLSIMPIDDSITIDGKKVALTPEQQADANRLAGQSARAALPTTWDWKNPTEDGITRIKDAVEAAQRSERDRLRAILRNP